MDTLQRKLLLLCNPGTPGVNYVQHVPNILNRYKAYFQSPIGGYWADSEIDEMPDSFDSKAQVTWLAFKLAEYAKDCDYSEIVFVGHGGSSLGNDYIQLSGGEIIPIQSLITTPGHEGKLKRTIYIDACRSLMGPTAGQLIFESRQFSGESQIEGTYCKELYNGIIAAAEPHIELIQSTQYGEPAKVTNTGSAFSDSLFDILSQNANTWNALALGVPCGQLYKNNNEILDMVKGNMGAYSQVPQYSRQGGKGDFPMYAVWRPVTRIL